MVNLVLQSCLRAHDCEDGNGSVESEFKHPDQGAQRWFKKKKTLLTAGKIKYSNNCFLFFRY